MIQSTLGGGSKSEGKREEREGEGEKEGKQRDRRERGRKEGIREYYMCVTEKYTVMLTQVSVSVC